MVVGKRLLNYKLLQNPGKNGTSPYQKASDKKAWIKCKETFREVYDALEKDNPFPGVCHYFSEHLILKNIHGRKIISIYLMFLIFILLNWPGSCYAQSQKNIQSQFERLVRKINTHTLCEINYNPSKTAAIVNDDCRSAIYINFKTKKTYTIANKKPAYHIFAKWINDSIVTVEDSCGTGCANVVVFVAPSVVFACPVHEFRIKSLNMHEPPDYYHNRPLLIDVYRKIVVCYDDANNIQVFPLPKQPTIHPPNGYFSEKAEIRNNKLMINYQTRQGKVKKIMYGMV